MLSFITCNLLVRNICGPFAFPHKRNSEKKPVAISGFQAALPQLLEFEYQSRIYRHPSLKVNFSRIYILSSFLNQYRLFFRCVNNSCSHFQVWFTFIFLQTEQLLNWAVLVATAQIFLKLIFVYRTATTHLKNN